MINRLQNYFDEGKDRVQTFTHDLEERFSDDFVPAARSTFKRGKKQMLSAEELLADTVREHQLAVMLIGIGLVAVIAGSIFARRRTQRDW